MRKILDAHAHPPPGKHGNLASPEEAARHLLAEMDPVDVGVTALLGTVHPGQSTEEMQRGNLQTAAIVELEPERFFGMVFVNPALPARDVRDELDRHLQTPHFRGIKLELDVNCRDDRLDVVMEKALEYQVPVLHHAWYLNTWSMGDAACERQQGRSEPHDVAALARRFPEARIIMAHLEGSGIRGILDVAGCPNVWIDTSGSLPFTGTLEFAVETLGSERILFGSDLTGRSLETQLGRIFGAQITDEARENILYRNTATLFGFKEGGLL